MITNWHEQHRLQQRDYSPFCRECEALTEHTVPVEEEPDDPIDCKRVGLHNHDGTWVNHDRSEPIGVHGSDGSLAYAEEPMPTNVQPLCRSPFCSVSPHDHARGPGCPGTDDTIEEPPC